MTGEGKCPPLGKGGDKGVQSIEGAVDVLTACANPVSRSGTVPRYSPVAVFRVNRNVWLTMYPFSTSPLLHSPSGFYTNR